VSIPLISSAYSPKCRSMWTWIGKGSSAASPARSIMRANALAAEWFAALVDEDKGRRDAVLRLLLLQELQPLNLVLLKAAGAIGAALESAHHDPALVQVEVSPA
jgi:hypothetical protein